MPQHTRRRLAVVAVVVLATVAGATAPVAADDHDESVFDTLFGDDDTDDSGMFSTFKAAVSGFIDRNRAAARAALTGGELAGTSADNLESVWNENTTVLLTWANERSTATTEADVLKLRIKGAQDSAVTRYVIADANETTGDYEAVGMVDSIDDMDLSVDEGCTLEGHAARNADAELAQFITEYAEPNEDVTQPYLAELGSEYAGDVDCTFSLTGGSSS